MRRYRRCLIAPTRWTFLFSAPATVPWVAPEPLRARFRNAHISFDAMTTGAAVRTYNVMLMESRRVGAGLIAVD